MYLSLIFVLFVLSAQAFDKGKDLTKEDKTKEDKTKDIEYDDIRPPCSWHPVGEPYGDRLKPIKKDPKDDKFHYHGGIYANPYGSMPYVTGLYTGPYGFEAAPIYQPPVYNSYIKKGNKEGYYSGL